MEQKEENKESTPSQITYENLVEAASHFNKRLDMLEECKDSQNQRQEATYRFFLNVQSYCSLLKINGSVMLMSFQSRRKLLLHKNTHLLAMVFSPPPTNNNTHTPVSQMESP